MTKSDESDRRFLRRAVHLAGKGRGRVHPNPQVGCVIVRGGRVVGEGWHAQFGGAHAEPTALKQAGSKAKGSTAYVTLEPCCYQGKTPPCTEALIAAGVSRVVASLKDPNPRVAGRGFARLRKAGIRVTAGLLQEEASVLIAEFVFWLKHRRPRVILKAAASLDGRIETASKQSKWITSAQARAASRRMRGDVDAILTGVDTVIADDPRLTASRGRSPLRVILDSRLRSPRSARVFSGNTPTLVATSAAPKAAVSGRSNVAWLKIPRKRNGLDLKTLLKRLADLGVARLLIEGGSKIHSSFLDAGLVDEIRLFLSPQLIGGESARTFYEGRGARDLSDSLRLQNPTVKKIGPDFLISGALRRGAR